MKFLKFLARDKKSIITFSLLHVSIVIFIGFMFSRIYVDNIPIGIVDQDNSSLSRTVIEQMKKSPGLNITYYPDSQEELEQAIKEKKISGGIVIPKNFNKDVIKKQSPSIALMIDETNTIVGGNLYGYCNTVIGTVNASIQLKTFEGKNMMPYNSNKAVISFSYSERNLYEPQLSYMRYLMYSMVPYLLQGSFLMTFLVPTLIKSRQKLNLIDFNLKNFIKNTLILFIRILMIITLAVVFSLISLCILDKCFDLPLRGNIWEYVVLTFIFLIDITMAGFAFAAIFDNLIYFTQFFTMINIVTFLTCGVGFPEYAMPSGLPEIIKSIWPFMNVALPLKAINLKGVGWDIILPYIKNGLVYALEWFVVGFVLNFSRIAFSKYKNNRMSKKENQNSELEEINDGEMFTAIYVD